MATATTITLHSSEISCDGCVNAIRVELEELEGVVKVSGSSDSQEVLVEFGPPTTADALKAAMEEIGYQVDRQA